MAENDPMSFWLAQSRLMWSRLQAALVIEGAVIAGWYKVWSDERPILPRALLIVGIVLLLAVSLLIRRDSEYMGAHEKATKGQIPRATHPILGLKGHWIAFAVPLLLALFNVALIFYN